MTQFLTPYFWFSLRGDLAPWSNFLLIAVIAIFVLGMAYLKVTEKTWKKTLWRTVYEKLTGFLFVNLIFSLYLWLVFAQAVPVLSARIWLLIWAVEMAVWLRVIYKDYARIPERKQQLEEKREKNKYIPK